MGPSRPRCIDGGYLVSGRHKIPDDPTVCYGDFHLPVVGCNRLRCLRCGEPVQNEAAGTSRRYLCSCAGWLECAVRPMWDDVDDADLPWRCAGHPGPTRPIDISEDPPATCASDSGA